MSFVAALLLGVASSVLFGLLLGFQHGFLDTTVAAISLVAGAGVGAIGWRQCRGATALPRPRGWAWLPVLFFALFSLRAFVWLIFRERDELRVLSPNNLGDMSLHLTLVHYLANGAPLWPDSPIFSAGKLTYAAGMDIFNSLLALIGVDVLHGLVWTGLLGAIAAGFALWRWGGAFVLLGFLCNGGLAGFACLTHGPDQPFFNDYQAEWAWKSLPLAIFVTQRGFLFALPAGLLLLCSWRTRFFLAGDGWKLPAWCEWLLYAAMPIFHLHTFMALSFLLAAFFIARASARASIGRVVGAAFVPATLLVYLTVGMFKTNAKPHFEDLSQVGSPPTRPPIAALGWQPGWMVNDDTTTHLWDEIARDSPGAEPFAAPGRFLVFWLGNFGVLPLLLIPMMATRLRPLLQHPLRPIEVWLLVAAAAAITPFLGGWKAYQALPLGMLLAGGEPARGLIAALAVAAICAGIFLHKRNVGASGIRWMLFALPGILLTDTILAGLHDWNPAIPMLRANAIPLVLATFAIVTLLFRMARNQAPESWQAAFVFPALYLFFLCCNVKFAVWDWDNTKIMIWAYLIVLPFVWDLLIARQRLWARAAVCGVLFFSGFVSLLGGINSRHRGHVLARLSELDAVTEVVRQIPITATFAGQPTYNHPLLLCGRKMVMGFEGHLGSHGIDYEEIRGDLDEVMNGSPRWRLLAARLGINYIYFGPGEHDEWPMSWRTWQAASRLVGSGEWGELYELDLQRPPRDDLAPASPTPLISTPR